MEKKPKRNSSKKIVMKVKENNNEKVNECVSDMSFSELINEIQSYEKERKIVKVDRIKHKEILLLRKEIIDWLVKVCESLNQSDYTFFLAVEIFDKVLEEYHFSLSVEDMHFTAIISLFIASKSFEVTPIKMEMLVNEVGHKKFSKYVIVQGEVTILKKLNFKLPKIFYLDFINNILHFTQNKDQSEYKQIIYEQSKLIFKFFIFNYTYKSINVISLYTAIFFYTLTQVDILTGSSNPITLNKFLHNITRFNIKSEELLNIMEKIKDFRKFLEENKKYFPFINCELSKMFKSRV